MDVDFRSLGIARYIGKRLLHHTKDGRSDVIRKNPVIQIGAEVTLQPIALFPVAHQPGERFCQTNIIERTRP